MNGVTTTYAYDGMKDDGPGADHVFRNGKGSAVILITKTKMNTL